MNTIIEQIKDHLQNFERHQLPKVFSRYRSASIGGHEALLNPESYISKQLGKLSNSELNNLLSELCKNDNENLSTESNVASQLRMEIKNFGSDYPDGKVAFIMMKFENTAAHRAIVDEIKRVCKKHGICARRADDKQYHEDLFPNIRVYMHGCDFGIAVFERISADDYNPNVSLEVGYMLGLDKKVCLLKDKTLRELNTDLVGKLYKPFDTRDVKNTLEQVLEKWLEDKGPNV